MLEVKDYQLGTKKAEDNATWKPTEEDMKLLGRLDEEFKAAISFRQNYEAQWQENIERYMARPFYHEDGRAGVVLPIAKWIIESKQATEMKSPPSFVYEPGEYEEDRPITKILEEVVRKHVWDLKHVDLDQKLDMLNQDKDILGTMYQYIGWRTVYRTIRTKKGKKAMEMQVAAKNDSADAPELNNVTVDKSTIDGFEASQVLYYDDVCVDNLYPQDVWLHPLARGVFDSPWLKARKRFDYSTFLETFSDTEIFDNVDLVKKGKWQFAQGGANDDESQFKPYTSTDTKDQVVVFEHWNVMRDELVIIANGVIIYNGENPFDHKELPFVDYIDRLQYNTYVGEGEPERIATICDAINAFINIAIDKEKRAGSGINLLDDDNSDFDDTSSIFDSGTAARVSDPKNAFVHYELPGMSATTDRIIGMLMDYLIYATGVDFRQITDLNASTQATVAAIRREISQGRLSLNVRRNENRGFKRLGWLLAEVVQQYYPLPIMEEIIGQDGEIQIKERPRMIRIKGAQYEEKSAGSGPDGKPMYTAKSLRKKSQGENDIGFFQARPSYLKTKGKVCVRVIPESTFSASRELEKANALDYVTTAAKAVDMDPTTGQPKPILSVHYGLEKYVQAMGYDKEKAFDLTGGQSDKVAANEAKKIMGMVPGGDMGTGGSAGLPALKGNLPTPEAPAKLTGVSSEPVQQLKADLANANAITKK